MRRGSLAVHELAAQLARLRTSCEWLRLHARLGGQLREALTAAGSPAWRPAEDLGWRAWIGRHGDEYARALVLEIDALLDERAAEIAAAGGLPEASSGPA